MPALNSDAGVRCISTSATCGVTPPYTGIDPYFDDLLPDGRQRRYLSVERVVSTDEVSQSGSTTGIAGEPDDGRRSGRSAGWLPLHHRCTGLRPRREVQRHYAEAAATDEGWHTFVQTYLSGGEAEYQAAVRKFAEEASS